MRRFSWLLFGSVLLGLTVSFVSSHADDPPKDKAVADQKATDDKKKADAKRDEDYELMRLFADTFEQIERNYVKDVDRRQLVQAAIKGMVTQLDPYPGRRPIPRRLSRRGTCECCDRWDADTERSSASRRWSHLPTQSRSARCLCPTSVRRR